MVSGSICAEVQVDAPASAAWEIYGTLKLPGYSEQALPNIVEKIELVHGDGSAGTLLQLFFLPGTVGFASYKEEYMIVDNVKRVKVGEVREGGYLDLGFTLYRLGYEIIEKDEECCITKATIEYDIKDEFAHNASIVSTDPIVVIMNHIANCLTSKS